MNDFISRAGLLGYLSKKCENESYTVSDMLSDIEKYGKNGEVTPLPTLPKEFEVLKNLHDYGCWDFKHYPLTKAEAETIQESMSELKKYRDSGLTTEQLAQVDEEYLKVVQKVPRWRKCSEELPENKKRVLLVREMRHDTSKISKRICTASYDYERKEWREVMGYGEFEIVSYPVAWQPLPEWEGKE